jgi:N-acetylneuraminate synthase
LFGVEIGLSDHTMGIGAAVASVALGVSVIEKHFTLSRAEGGVDSAFSLEPAELASLVVETERAWRALGEVKYGPTDSELNSLVFRRSIYVAEEVRAGESFTTKNLRIVRPANGLHPRFYSQVLGRSASRDVKLGTPLSWDLLK